MKTEGKKQQKNTGMHYWHWQQRRYVRNWIVSARKSEYINIYIYISDQLHDQGWGWTDSHGNWPPYKNKGGLVLVFILPLIVHNVLSFSRPTTARHISAL